MLLQVGAGFRVVFGVIVLWCHDTMMLLVSALCVSFSCVVFYALWSRLRHCLPLSVKEGLRV